jgi:hypothetical protein
LQRARPLGGVSHAPDRKCREITFFERSSLCLGEEKDEPNKHDEIDGTPDPANLWSPAEMLRIEEIGEGKRCQPSEKEGNAHGETESNGAQTVRGYFTGGNPGNRTNGIRVSGEINVDHGNDSLTLGRRVVASACRPDNRDEKHGDGGDCSA